MPSNRRAPSLARRVGVAIAAAALLSALLVLGVSTLIVDRLQLGQARDEALQLAAALARELDPVELADMAALEAELREFSIGEVELVVWDPRGELIVGTRPLPRPSETCRQGEIWLVCAVEAEGGSWVGVGIGRGRVFAHRVPLLIGGGSALALALLLSGFGGRWLSRATLLPLGRLERWVEAVEPDRPEARPAFVRPGLREIDRLADATEALLERLSAELQRSRRFSADAAHELRTPLAKLRAELELGVECLGTHDHEAGRLLTKAVERTAALGRLLDRLLVLASPEHALEASTLVSLAALLEERVGELEPSPRARVLLDLEADGLIRGDAAVLDAALGNALDNALAYTEGEVRIRTRLEGEEVVVRIDDDGPGLGEQGRRRAFEPFYRGPEPHVHPGHGIGLALIAHVARAHAGTARFLEPEPGAKLELRFPAHRARTG